MSGETKQTTDWSLITRFWTFLRPYRTLVISAFSIVPVTTGMSLLQPYLLKVGIDDFILQETYEGLPELALLLLGLVLGTYFLAGIQTYCLQVAVVRGIGDLRMRLYRHVMAQSSRFFDRHASGSLMTRSTTDVESLGEMVSSGMLTMFGDALLIVGILGTMLTLDAELTLLTFCVAPLVIWIVNICRRKLREYGLKIRKSLSRLNGYLAEHLNGVRVIRSLGRAETSKQEFKELNYSYLSAYKKSNWYDASLYAVMDGLSNMCVALMLWYGGLRLLDGDTSLSLGLLVAFVEYTSRLFIPVRDLSGKFATLQRAMAALERIFGLLDDSDRLAPGTQMLPTNAPTTWRVQDVRFRYREDTPEVLKGVTFELKPGQSVALVGRTGSGKSTIGRLLSRTYGGYEGSIQVNGVELNSLTLANIRSLVTVIHQDVFLFAGTIEENITLGSPHLSSADARAAAEWVGANGFIEQLPGGYQFEVKERGQNLSAGQAQLVAFARAIAHDAPLLILDEATSNVDPSLEATIQTTIERIMKSKTVLIVAHRLSTIESADEILVLGDGEVLERGSHQALAALGGVYSELLAAGDES